MNSARTFIGLTFLVLAAFPVFAGEVKGGAGLLRSWEFASPRLDALPLWRDALQRIERERVQMKKCDRDIEICSSSSMVAWRAKIRELQAEDPRQKVDVLRRFLNHWPHRTDKDAYGKQDHWASPIEFLERSGDDEDFAIMSYVSLREAGIKIKQLRLVMVKDSLSGRNETILAVYLGDEVLLLSNQWPTPISDRNAMTYVPFISFNEDGRWLHVPISTIQQETSSRGPSGHDEPVKAR